MADNVFDILIKFGLDKSKAAEAAAELTKLQTQTKAASSASVDFSKVQAELEKNVTKTSTATAAFNVNKREFLKLASLLPPQLQAVGHALKFAFSSPIVAAVAGLLLVIRGITSAVAEARTKLDNLKLEGLPATLNATSAAAARNAISWDNWKTSIAAAGTAADDSLEKIRAVTTAAGEVADAEFDLARAKVESDPNLSPEQKSQALASIDQQQKQSGTNRSRALRAAEIADAEKKLTAARTQDENALAGRKGVADAAHAASFALNENTGLIDGLDADIKRLEEKEAAGTATSADRQALRIAQNQRAVLVAKTPGLESAAKNATGALADYDRGAMANRAAIPTLEKQLTALRENDALRTSTENTVGSLSAQAARTRNLAGLGDPAAQFIPGAAAAARNSMFGQSPSASDAGDFSELFAALKLSQQQLTALKKLLLEIYKDGIVTPEEMAQLRSLTKTQGQRQ